MLDIPIWEYHTCSTGQEIPRLFWNPSIYYHFHISPSLDRIKRYLNPVHIFTRYFFQSSFLFSHLRLGLAVGLFFARFQNKVLYAYLLSPMHVTCPTHIALFDLNTLTIFG
jgi:hypothetical protein